MKEHEPSPVANFAETANELAPLAGLAEAQVPAVRDDKGRFLTGNSGGGRPKGSRNRLTDTFLWPSPTTSPPMVLMRLNASERKTLPLISSSSAL